MKKIFLALLLVTMTAAAYAQDAPKTKEEKIKALYESVDQDVEKMTGNLDLADWQVFKVDSTLTHDIQAMVDEMEKMSASGITNLNLYTAVQDKWAESTYLSYKTFLTEEQWAKYLKSGAARAKKARDKRAAKAVRDQEKLKARLSK